MGSLTFNQEMAVTNAIAEQIWREQNLIANRMNWNLTFQGFMIAGFALIATADFSTPDRKTLELIVAAAGILVSSSTFAGIFAAQRQLTRLKRHWTNLFANASGKIAKQDETQEVGDPTKPLTLGRQPWFPQPFSDKVGSYLGRYPTWVICGTLVGMWFALATFAWRGLERDAGIQIKEPVTVQFVNPVNAAIAAPPVRADSAAPTAQPSPRPSR